MQAILTKYHGPTNTRGSRISATCERGRIFISYPDNLSTMGEECHREAARQLLARFVAEDRERYGSDDARNPWAWPFVSGCLPSGEWVHVLVAPVGQCQPLAGQPVTA